MTFFKQITSWSQLWIWGNYWNGFMMQLELTPLIFGNRIPQVNQNCPALMKYVQFLCFTLGFTQRRTNIFVSAFLPKSPHR